MADKESIYEHIQNSTDLTYLKRYDADQVFKMLSGICKADGMQASYENMLLFIPTLESDLESSLGGASSDQSDDGLEYEY